MLPDSPPASAPLTTPPPAFAVLALFNTTAAAHNVFQRLLYCSLSFLGILPNESLDPSHLSLVSACHMISRPRKNLKFLIYESRFLFLLLL